MINYRFATIEDKDKLVEINMEGHESFRRISENVFSGFIPAKRVLVCEKDGEIIGMIYWVSNFMGRTNFYYIDQITTLKPFRRNGYALNLLKKFIKVCRDNKIKKIFADIHNDNFASINLFLKVGFLISGVLEGLGDTKKKDERLIMRLEL